MILEFQRIILLSVDLSKYIAYLTPISKTACSTANSISFTLLMSFASSICFLQCCIHTSQPVPLEVQGNKQEPEFPKSLIDFLPNSIGSQSRNIRRRHFDSGNIAMQSHAFFQKAVFDQNLFCPVDHVKLFFGNLFSICKSRCKTGVPRFAPGRQSQCFRKKTNVRLRKVRLSQRAFYREF